LVKGNQGGKFSGKHCNGIYSVLRMETYFSGNDHKGHPLKGPCQEGKRIRCKKKIFS
jgi:hypothetical protein